MRDLLVALDRARHARRPQELVAEVAVDELVQVEQVLQQLPARRERGRDELDERLGVVGRDVLVRERGARARRGCAVCAMRASGVTRRDSFSTPLRPPCRICGSPLLISAASRRSNDAVDRGSQRYQRIRRISTSRSMTKSPARLYRGCLKVAGRLCSKKKCPTHANA